MCMEGQIRGWVVGRSPVPAKGMGFPVGSGSSQKRWVADGCPKIAGGYGCSQLGRLSWMNPGQRCP